MLEDRQTEREEEDEAAGGPPPPPPPNEEASAVCNCRAICWFAIAGKLAL